jgi:hypothetical protein
MPEAFHDAFAAALAGDAAALSSWCDAPDLQARLDVYRNTIAKGCADALVAQFPTVGKVVGEPWLAAAARRFAQVHPPTEPSLLTYGAGFPDWLARFPPAADMPFLPGLAALDMLWTQAHLAADAEPLRPDALGALAPEAFSRAALTPHPAARLAWFDAGLPSLWLALQADAPPERLELDDRPEGLLFVRPALRVEALRLSRGAYVLAAACAEGRSLAAAAAEAAQAEPEAALDAAFARLLTAGAFAALTFLEAP